VTGSWRKLHNEELHNLYSSPNIIRMLKSRRMRWAGHVARREMKRQEVGKLHSEELHNLYSSPSIIRIIMSRRVRVVGHVKRREIK
jgi:hypothetical protein